MNKIIKKVAYIWICTIIILAKECYGYLDPSAMTYIIQIVAAIGIAVATGFGVILYKIKRFFKNKNKKENKPEE